MTSSTALSNIMIRLAEPRDHSILVDFQIRMAKETENLDLQPITVQKGVLHILNHPQTGQYWIAETAALEKSPNPETKVIGCMLTLFEWSDWRNGNVLWVHSVFVEPSARKQGVFQSLYSFQKQRVLSDPHLRGIRLYVDRRNKNAQTTYQRVGMSAEHYELYEWLK